MKRTKVTGILAISVMLLVTACSTNRESAAPGTTVVETIAETQTFRESQLSAESQSSDGSRYSFAIQTGGAEIGK